MKKALSIILAAAMILSLIPSVFAEEGEATVYTYNFNSKDTSCAYSGILSTSTLLKKVTNEDGSVTVEINDQYADYDDTTGRHWKMFATVEEVKTKFKDTTSKLYNVAGFEANSMRVNFPGNKQWFALKIRVPEPGIYKMSTIIYQATSSRMSTGFMSLYPGDTPENQITYGTNGTGGNQVLNSLRSLHNSVPYKGSEANYPIDFSKVLCANTSNEEFIYVFGSLASTNGSSAIKNFKLTKISDEIKFDKEKIELQVGEEQEIAVSLATQKLHGASKVIFSTSDDEGIVSIPKSDSPNNSGVATLTVVADKAGETTITARIGDATASIPVKVTAPEEEDPVADSTVSFAETTNIDGFDNIDVKSVSRGEAVELTAHKKDIPGYKFIGWKRGADTSEKNAWVEISGDTYNIWTNTYLTAVYEKETDATEKAVEFWNQNGAYIGKMDEETYNAEDELFKPSLVGFGKFLGWFTKEATPFTAGMTLANGITNVVAQYSASSVSGITFNGNPITGADTYDTAIELSANSDATTCWKRDGEIIAYGDSYTFNVWDATNITEGTEEITDKVPVAVLDYSEKYEAYMLEYDAGDYEIVEAGIIFGKDTPAMKRFTSQRKVSHNQFTVPEEEGLDATGYIVYTLDKGASYKFKYVTVSEAE